MPKNKGKGGKNRRRGKNENDQLKRELDLKEEGQEYRIVRKNSIPTKNFQTSQFLPNFFYAQVTKILGNGRVRCMCFDGKERLCNIRGKMRKKVWIGVGDIVLLGLRDFQDEKADVIQKYKPDEARRLKAQGHIPDNIQLDADVGNQKDTDVVFRNAGDSDDGEGEDEENALGIPPQQDYRGFSDLETTSEEEDDSEEEEDDSDGDYYQPQPLDKFTNSSKPNNKKDFSIDNI